MSGQLVNLAILAVGGYLTMQNWPRIEAMLNDIMGSFGGGGGAAAPPAAGEEYAEPAAGEGEPVGEAEGTEGEEGGEKAPTGDKEGGGGGEDEESKYARAYRAYMVRAFATDPYWQRRRRQYLMRPRLYVI